MDGKKVLLAVACNSLAVLESERFGHFLLILKMIRDKVCRSWVSGLYSTKDSFASWLQISLLILMRIMI